MARGSAHFSDIPKPCRNALASRLDRRELTITTKKNVLYPILDNIDLIKKDIRHRCDRSAWKGREITHAYARFASAMNQRVAPASCRCKMCAIERADRKIALLSAQHHEAKRWLDALRKYRWKYDLDASSASATQIEASFTLWMESLAASDRQAEDLIVLRNRLERRRSERDHLKARLDAETITTMRTLRKLREDCNKPDKAFLSQAKQEYDDQALKTLSYPKCFCAEHKNREIAPLRSNYQVLQSVQQAVADVQRRLQSLENEKLALEISVDGRIEEVKRLVAEIKKECDMEAFGSEPLSSAHAAFKAGIQAQPATIGCDCAECRQELSKSEIDVMARKLAVTQDWLAALREYRSKNDLEFLQGQVGQVPDYFSGGKYFHQIGTYRGHGACKIKPRLQMQNSYNVAALTTNDMINRPLKQAWATRTIAVPKDSSIPGLQGKRTRLDDGRILVHDGNYITKKGRNIRLEETTVVSIERPKAANQTLKLTLD
ncbi:hypothetical protein MBLNU13_g04810t1 [Cladosporium sp. NU13]